MTTLVFDSPRSCCRIHRARMRIGTVKGLRGYVQVNNRHSTRTRTCQEEFLCTVPSKFGSQMAS